MMQGGKDEEEERKEEEEEGRKEAGKRDGQKQVQRQGRTGRGREWEEVR